MEIGQKLWYVDHPRNGRQPDGYEVTIEKIGRKWATLANNRGRVDIETLTPDSGGYSANAQCYLTEQHYKDHIEKETAWKEFMQLIQHQWHAPRNITIIDIKRMIAVIKDSK